MTAELSPEYMATVVHTLKLEGDDAFTDDPHDPGGATKFGISLRYLRLLGDENDDGFLDGDVDRDGDVDANDVRALTLEGSIEKYHRFWRAVKGDSLPMPLALFVFDTAVNQGEDPARKLLQKAAGVKQDGILGPITLGRVATADGRELCALFLADRMLRYTGTRNFDRYGRGWFARQFRMVWAVPAP